MSGGGPQPALTHGQPRVQGSGVRPAGGSRGRLDGDFFEKQRPLPTPQPPSSRRLRSASQPLSLPEPGLRALVSFGRRFLAPEGPRGPHAPVLSSARSVCGFPLCRPCSPATAPPNPRGSRPLACSADHRVREGLALLVPTRGLRQQLHGLERASGEITRARARRLLPQLP